MEKITTSRQQKTGISSSVLKYIALITMLIDHFGASFLIRYIRVNNAYDQYLNFYNILRYIGRVSFPIFIFLLIEGLQHTRDIRKYLFRLFLFCFISEIPFDLAFYYKPFDWNHQNVFFTLLIGLSAIAVFKVLIEKRKKELCEESGEGQCRKRNTEEEEKQCEKDRKREHHKKCSREKHSRKNLLKNPLIFYSVEIVIGGAAMVLANYLKTDYKWAGVLAIITAYILRSRPGLQMLGVCTVLYLFSSDSEIFALFCIPFILLYNGQRGDMPKWIPYVFYPVHLLILWGITKYICG